MVGVREKERGGGTSELPSALGSVDTNKNIMQFIKDMGNAIPESYSTRRSPIKGAMSRLAYLELVYTTQVNSAFRAL